MDCRWYGRRAPTRSSCRRRRCCRWPIGAGRPATSTATSGGSAACCRPWPAPSEPHSGTCRRRLGCPSWPSVAYAGEGMSSGAATVPVMPTLSFDGETHAELVSKVRRWLGSVEGEEEVRTPAEVIGASAELTKDALRIMASAAPAPVAQSEMVKGLTALGYQMTDAASTAM